MRYEKPECVLLGEAQTIVLGGPPATPSEHVLSSIEGELIGYDE